jgi:hypothetical protein
MEMLFKACGTKEKKMVKEHTITMTDPHTRETLFMAKNKALDT